MRYVIFILAFLLSLACVFADDNTLSLTFVGDIMAHDVNYTMKDYDAIYGRVREFFENDDLTFGNLEFPIVDDLPFSSYPLFNVQSPYVQAALDAHIEVFSVANNHTLDKSELGVLKTLGSLILLKESVNREMYYSGIRGDVKKPFLPVTIYKNGFKIGFLAVTQFLNNTQLTPYINIADYNNKDEADRFIAWIRSIAPQYDLFILSYHGDVEYTQTPNHQKQVFFRALVRAGVNIIWSHHPHVLQPYEIIDVNGSKRLIMYSLGNFVSGQGYYVNPNAPASNRANTGDSAMMRVSVSRNENNEATVTGTEPVLIANYTTPTKEIIVDNLEHLAASTLPGNWGEYYKTRLNIMRQFLADMKKYLDKDSN